MPLSTDITVTLADAPEIAALLDAAATKLREMECEVELFRRERDRWEEQYFELLSACGGVWPG